MKPSVISDSNGRTTSGTGTNNLPPNGNNLNGINIPVNHHHQYGVGGHQQQPQQQHSFVNDPNVSGYNSPSNRQFPSHFQQSFGFDPDIDSMFTDSGMRSRLGSRMQDPFGTFGSRKRCGNEPHQTGSSYFDDDPDFFPQFGTLGNRRRAGTGSGMPTMDAGSATDGGDDFFDRLPPEFRQYIPEGFGTTHRRSGSTGQQSPRTQQQQQPQQQHTPQYYQKSYNQPESPKILRDAAIQTEQNQTAAATAADSIDGHSNPNGLRNTIDFGVKSKPEEYHGIRAQSAPPNEQQTTAITSPRVSGGGLHRNTPPPQQHNNGNFSTQTSPKVGISEPNFQGNYYSTHNRGQPHQSQQQSSNQQSQPSTPGGSYIRTIPIFVEGRSEPIINSHKEIPNQSQASGSSSASNKSYQSPTTHQQQQQQQHQHQQRPTPLNTQQAAAVGMAEQQTGGMQQQQPVPPQTPHTMESINKIQDIQRDVLALMAKVEKFSGKRKDKEYAYLDEMLTRNLLKLDTIDTNGKESIRMARKEAIKCIQASINVLEAKAEENAKKEASENTGTGVGQSQNIEENSGNTESSGSVDVQSNKTPIPLPPPPETHKESSPAKENVAESETVVDAKTE